jgi:probable HAF family extracellular repeat protein
MNCKRMVKNILAGSALAAALPAIAVAQTTPTFRVTNLTAVPGSSACLATTVNDAGVVAGNCPSGAAIWRNGTVVSLGTLPDGHSAYTTSINSLGTIVGDADTSSFLPNPFVSVNGHLLDVDPINGGNARTVGITDTGVIFGNLTKSLSGNTSSWNVIMWTADPGHPGRYRENILPKYPGGDQKANGVFATASNKAGQVVGWVTTSLIGQLGGFWNNDSTHSVVALQPLPNGNHAIAWGVNDLGQAVGESNTAASFTRAVLWQNDPAHTPVDLGTLSGDMESTATGVNIAGQVIGVSSPSIYSGTRRAFFYQNGAMQDLATLIDPADGVWTIDSVFAINNAGQIIAIGTSNGQGASILLTPVAQ